MSVQQHRATSPSDVTCFVLTVSDSRTLDGDRSGDAIAAHLVAAGHTIVDRRLVRDDPDEVRAAVDDAIRRGDASVVITTGGTGITSRDSTYEALTARFDKTLDGFGELFRMLSFQEIGAAAMLSRATAGVVGRTAVFMLPGSPAAVDLAMTKLIVPELGHVVRELRR
ncbi:MAG: MogA/MoaB family molybdenum cofactor biosynthesis protein [Acidobacteria bacterium]|nr:MogA/MoaB family molybdenum cofactor biosynthesis protein [Acidobacteriota bacterium]